MLIALFATASNCAGWLASARLESRSRPICEEHLRRCRNPFLSPTRRSLARSASSPATALSRRKGWASPLATSSVCSNAPKARMNRPFEARGSQPSGITCPLPVSRKPPSSPGFKKSLSQSRLRSFTTSFSTTSSKTSARAWTRTESLSQRQAYATQLSGGNSSIFSATASSELSISSNGSAGASLRTASDSIKHSRHWRRGGYSPAYIDSHRTMLNSIFNYAIRNR